MPPWPLLGPGPVLCPTLEGKWPLPIAHALGAHGHVHLPGREAAMPPALCSPATVMPSCLLGAFSLVASGAPLSGPRLTWSLVSALPHSAANPQALPATPGQDTSQAMAEVGPSLLPLEALEFSGPFGSLPLGSGARSCRSLPFSGPTRTEHLQCCLPLCPHSHTCVQGVCPPVSVIS